MAFLDVHSVHGIGGLLGALYRFYWLFFSCLRLEVGDQTLFNFTMYRVVVLMILWCTIPCLIIWNHVGFWLDDLLFAVYEKEEITTPLFIVGNARSGTTFFHRLVTSADADSPSTVFTTARTWELAFGQSVSWRVLFVMIYRLDKFIFRGCLYYLLSRTERYLFGSIHVHAVGLQEAEEDEWAMLSICLSQLIMFFFPLGGHLMDPLVLFDYQNATPEPTKRAIFQFYRKFVQRHVYARRLLDFSKLPRKIIFVSKNPPFTMRLQSLMKAFPDARIICLLRDPCDSVPSMVSYIGRVWQAFASPTTKYPKAEGLVGFCEAHYAFPRVVFGTVGCLSAEHCTYASYKALLSKPSVEVMRVLNHVYGNEKLDLTHMLPRLQVEDEAAHKKVYKSRHTYTLEQVTGLNRNEMQELLPKSIYEENNF